MKVMKKNAIRAYKAFNSDWTCQGFQYEVGKTYRVKGEISLCENGFHACERASDCFNYYPFDPKKIKFAEVICWGNIEKTAGDSKLCCENIQLIHEMSWEDVLKVCNTGDWNTGNGNSGYYNSGHYNSGYYNSGYYNSGNRNSGNWNTGSCNSGNWNTGNRNSGYYNSGYYNSGNRNSGNWNSGNMNSGHFNTGKQNKIFCFNKLTKKQVINFPSFLYFDLTEWIPISVMSADEKNEHPECDVLGGYLKRHNYKEAFRKSFMAAKEKDNWKEELAMLKAIPNFDYEIFAEISGISKKELEN